MVFLGTGEAAYTSYTDICEHRKVCHTYLFISCLQTNSFQTLYSDKKSGASVMVEDVDGETKMVRVFSTAFWQMTENDVAVKNHC